MKLNFQDYQRLFSHPALRFLINEIAIKGYENMGLVSIVKDDDFTCYMPKSMIEKTSKEGLVLYGSKEKFNEYVERFRDIYKKLKDFCEKMILSQEISEAQIRKYFDLCIDIVSQYKKSEFIYVDKPYLESLNSDNQELKENLKRYEKIKFEFRDYLNILFMGKESHYHKILENLAKRFSINAEDLQQYSTEEIYGLFNGKKLNPKIIRERYHRNIIIDDNGNLKAYWGEQAEKIIDNFLDKSEDKQEISGTIVNKGKVIGKVKIIRPGWNEDFTRIKKAMEEMNKGDILVSETTSPDIMPAIKKAGAIVTDQGGLMSHAAIMAREMNVPGIVGAGNATKILKDGDLVEVDADKGIVRILKKKN